MPFPWLVPSSELQVAGLFLASPMVLFCFIYIVF
jgi:hypothetical protein